MIFSSLPYLWDFISYTYAVVAFSGCDKTLLIN